MQDRADGRSGDDAGNDEISGMQSGVGAEAVVVEKVMEADHVLRGGCFVEDRVDPDAVLVESPGHGDAGGALDGRWFDWNGRGGSPAGFGIGGRDGGRDGLRWVGNADRVYTFVDENDSALIGLGGGKLSGFADALRCIVSRSYDDRGLHGASDNEAMAGIEECESVVGEGDRNVLYRSLQ